MINDDLLDCTYGKKWRLDGVPYSGETRSSTGALRWYKDGRLHKEDGPAVEWYDGSKEWWIHGDLHREDGPAIELADGHKAWWIHGLRHREDGPAIELADGSKLWHIHGKRIYIHMEGVS